MEKLKIWGKIPLKKNSNYEFVVHNVRLQLNSNSDILAFKIAAPDEEIEDAELNRVVGRAPEMHILPALPDRTLVLKPKTNLSVLPFTTFKFFVYLPITFQLYAGSVKAENMVFERELKHLSSTWFGEPNDGELCYALYTSFDTEINPEKKGNDFVICPIEIANNSKEILEIKRLAVRAIHLNIYGNGNIMISNKVKIKYNGYETLSDVQFTKSATSSIPNLKQVAQARVPEGHAIFKRSFQLIRHITQF